MDEGVPAGLSRAEGRKFGLTLGLAFLVLGGIAYWRGYVGVAVVPGAIGSTLVLMGLVAPGALGPVQRGWMKFGFALSRVTTPIILAVMYFAIILPFGLAMRAAGKHPLVRRPGDSYWVPRPEGGRRSRLDRQF